MCVVNTVVGWDAVGIRAGGCVAPYAYQPYPHPHTHPRIAFSAQANVLDVWRKHFVLEENMLEVRTIPSLLMAVRLPACLVSVYLPTRA